MRILGIESSCDETAAAVVEDGRRILGSAVASQIAEHNLYGGVVPEIASRRHAEAISAVTAEALRQAGLGVAELDAVAVTYAPGLIGALIVGVSFAKSLALAAGKPLVPVHHIRGHVASLYLDSELEPPFLALVASGGHTTLLKVEDYTRFVLLGSTLDDAAGEVLDKTARAMGLGYPGGAAIDRAAEAGDPTKIPLPLPQVREHALDMSFSGLKTAVVNLLHTAEQRGEHIETADLAAAVQERVVQALVSRLALAADESGLHALAGAGGVSANRLLRRELERLAERRGDRLYLPPKSLCGDNACMIAAQGYYEFCVGVRGDAALNACANMDIENPRF